MEINKANIVIVGGVASAGLGLLALAVGASKSKKAQAHQADMSSRLDKVEASVAESMVDKQIDNKLKAHLSSS